MQVYFITTHTTLLWYGIVTQQLYNDFTLLPIAMVTPDLPAFYAIFATCFLSEVLCIHWVTNIIKQYKTKMWFGYVGFLMSPHVLKIHNEKIHNEIHGIKLHELNFNIITWLGDFEEVRWNKMGRELVTVDVLMKFIILSNFAYIFYNKKLEKAQVSWFHFIS